MKKATLGITILLLALAILAGCAPAASLAGEWERTDTASPLYGMILKVEETSNGYVAKITYLTDISKEYTFKTGATKWKDITPTKEDHVYILQDYTINAINGKSSWSDMYMKFDPSQPNEIYLWAVEDGVNFMASNKQTYRRLK